MSSRFILGLLGSVLCGACGGAPAPDADDEAVGSASQALHSDIGRSAWLFYDGARIKAGTSYNSQGLANSVTHPSTGKYEVTLQGMADPQIIENIQISVVEKLGLSAAFCKVSSADSRHAQAVRGLHVHVACYDRLGERQDAAFYLSHIDYNFPFAVSFDPQSFGTNAAVSYTDNGCVAASIPGVNHDCDRFGPGRYRVVLPGPRARGGTVQLTAAGGDVLAAHCNVEAWSPTLTGTEVFVNCFDGVGGAHDSGFYLQYRRKVLENQGGFVRADRPGSDRYVPNATYNDRVGACWSQPLHDIYVQRATPSNGGQYLVTYPFLGELVGPKVVHTTPFGSGSTFCRLNSDAFRPGDEPDALRSYVNCYNSAGGRVDSKFTQLALVNANPICVD